MANAEKEITSTETALSPVNAQTAASVRNMAKGLKLKKRVTIPLLKQRVGMPIAVVFMSAMTESAPLASDKSGKKDPATIAKVFSLFDETVYQIIIGTVTRSELEKAYPDNGYVGKAFYIELHKVEGKNYHVCDLQEVEIPDGMIVPSE